jgi:hypothetical protein
MDVLSIQGLMRKLQSYEKKINEIHKDISAHALFFILTIYLFLSREKS